MVDWRGSGRKGSGLPSGFETTRWDRFRP